MIGIGQKVKFMAFGELIGDYENEGVVEGYGNHAKKLWGDEVALVRPDEAYVIRAVDQFGNINRHLVYKNRVIEIV